MRRIITRTTQTTVIWTISWSDVDGVYLEAPSPKPPKPLSLAPRRKAALRFGTQSRWRKIRNQ